MDNDWSSAQLHVLSEKIVAATQPSESPEPTAVQQKLKDVVEFGEHNCLQHARLKVVSLLQPQGTVPATTETDPEQARARILQVLAPSAEDIKGASSKVQQLVAMKDYIRIVSLNEHRDILLRKGVDAVVMDRLRDIPLMRFCRKDVVRRLEGVVDLVARLGRELPWLDEGDMPMDAETFKEWMEGMQEVVGRLGADERATALKEASYSCMTSLGNAGWMFQVSAFPGGWVVHDTWFLCIWCFVPLLLGARYCHCACMLVCLRGEEGLECVLVSATCPMLQTLLLLSINHGAWSTDDRSRMTMDDGSWIMGERR